MPFRLWRIFNLQAFNDPRAWSLVWNCLVTKLRTFHKRKQCILHRNRPFSYSRYWTGTSVQVRLMRGSLFKCKLHSCLSNDIPPHEPPLHASSSPIPRIRKWPIELKCCIGLTLLSEGLAGFWLYESLDSLLPISRWITVNPFSILCTRCIISHKKIGYIGKKNTMLHKC